MTPVPGWPVADVAEDFQLGEWILIGGIGLAIFYLLNKAGIFNSEFWSDPFTWFRNQAGIGVTTAPADYVASGKPLKANQADAISKALQKFPNVGYHLSPDGIQILWDDGSWYDNSSGHVFDAAGNDLGTILDASGQIDWSRIGIAPVVPLL